MLFRSGRVEVTVDVTFDESNGSQIEQVDPSVVGIEEPPCEEIKQLAIGDIRPQEDNITEVEVPQAADEQSSADVPDAEGEQTPTANQQSGSAALPLTVAASPTPIQGQNLQPIFKQEDNEDSEDGQEAIDHPMLRQTIQRHHPIDNILGSLRKGVTTRSHLANFCQYYSFVSSLSLLR